MRYVYAVRLAETYQCRCQLTLGSKGQVTIQAKQTEHNIVLQLPDFCRMKEETFLERVVTLHGMVQAYLHLQVPVKVAE